MSQKYAFIYQQHATADRNRPAGLSHAVVEVRGG